MIRATEAAFRKEATQLVATLQQETALARTGALSSLEAASQAKREAFDRFKKACAALDPDRTPDDAECAALRAVIQAADENALVLEAVGSAVGQFIDGLRSLVRSMADSGTYDPVRPVTRHVGALHLNTEI